MKNSILLSPKRMLLGIFMCFIGLSSFSQTNQKSDFWDHVRFGGGIGLSFGNNLFSATLAPSAIYQFDNQFALGLSLNGTYLKRDNIYKSTILGGSLIGLYNPFNEIQLSAEFEELHVSRNFENDLFVDDDFWQPALFFGIGYRTGNFTVGLRYNVLHDDDKSIYADALIPFFRVYF